MTGDKLARVLTGLAVLAVAVIAAAISFVHIESVALVHGQPLAAARALPLSVDGLLVVSSLVLLTEARAHRPAPRLARAGLVLGVTATILANLAYGARFGPVGAVVSVWPAVAFIVATEILAGQVRRAGDTPAVPEAIEAVADGVAGVAADVADQRPVLARVDVPQEHVPTAHASTPRTVASGCARRASKPASRTPERVFAAELAAGSGAESPGRQSAAPRGHRPRPRHP